MNKHEDFGKYLFTTYPNLFQKELYVECGTGWFDIVDELSKQIADYVSKFPVRTEEPYVNVVQIKEKFGGLRYYIHYHNLNDDQIQEVENLVRVAEIKSCTACEDCGGDGTKVAPRKYWMRTLCPKCIENYDMGDTPNGQ